MSEQIRQLAVIMFTDIAGYTSMMGEDENKAFSLLKINRKIHKKWIDRYNGKWLKEMGDGVLASFASVSDAVYCAAAIQKESADIEELNLRIGIHLGEVIVEVGDVFGDGVNIASRIESQAEAGSIHVSDSVYRNLTNKKGIATEFVKEETLKNVKHPVKIYRISVDHSYDGISDDIYTTAENKKKASVKKKANAWKKPTFMIVAAFFVFLLGFFIYNQFGKGPIASKDISQTVIVLPFENLGSPDDNYFAKGITDEITSRLSMIKGLSIISPLSAARFVESGLSIQEMADELDVDFVLDGSIRWDKAGESQKVRITPRLTRVSNNRQEWTNNYDRNIEQIFEVQSEIAERVAQALDITLMHSERQSLQLQLTDNIQAYDLYLQGVAEASEIDAQKYRAAQEFFEEAIALDPDFAAAYARLGALNADFWWHYLDRDSSRLVKAKFCIDKANELNPELFEVMLSSGLIHYHGFREYDEALEHFYAALKLKPNDSEVLASIAFVNRRQGKYQEAIDYLLTAYDLDPLSMTIPFTLGETYSILRNYDKSIYYFNKAIQLAPEWDAGYADKAQATFFSTGNASDAQKVINDAPISVRNSDNIRFILTQLLMLNEQYEEALALTEQIKTEGFLEQFKCYCKALTKGDIYFQMGNKELANIYYDSARIFTENKIEENPGEEKYHSALGIIYARLGMHDEAIEEALRATELMTISIDTWAAYDRQTDLAKVYALSGENDLAFEKIDYLLSTPGFFTKTDLEFDPYFNTLIDLPAYKEIMEKQY